MSYILDHADEVLSVICSPTELKSNLNLGESERAKELLSTPDELAEEILTNASSTHHSETFESHQKLLLCRLPSNFDDEEEEEDSFTERYARIQNFLDLENLEVECFTPLKCFKLLKPCLKMELLTPLTTRSAGSNEAISFGNLLEKTYNQNAVPSFMLKRAVSSGLVNNVKNILMTETKISLFKKGSLN